MKNPVSRLCIILITLSLIILASPSRVASVSLPSPVGTTHCSVSTLGNWVRHNWYMAGRHWVFWLDSDCSFAGGNIDYATSIDGVNWSNVTQIQPFGTSYYKVVADYEFSTWFNGTHFFYSAGSFSYQEPFEFRMGRPQSNGTIIWSGAQHMVNPTSPAFQDIKTDSNGYVWLSWSDFDGNAYAVQDMSRNGSWQPGPVYTISPGAGHNYEPEIIPLMDGRVYFETHVVSGAQPNIYGSLWNGSAMRPVELVSNFTPYLYTSSVSTDNNVYTIYSLSGNNSIVFQARTFANSSWSQPAQINPAESNRGLVSLSLLGNSQLIAFWLNMPTNNTAYYRVYTIATKSWGPVAIWFTEPLGFTIDPDGVPGRPGSFYQDYGNATSGYIGFQYAAGKTSPFIVKYAFLVFGPAKFLVLTQNIPSVVVQPNH